MAQEPGGIRKLINPASEQGKLETFGEPKEINQINAAPSPKDPCPVSSHFQGPSPRLAASSAAVPYAGANVRPGPYA